MFDSDGPYGRAAQYVRGSGTTALVFRHVVTEGIRRIYAALLRFLGYDAPPFGDEDSDGLSIVADALDLNDGTIRDSDNHDAWVILDALTNAGEYKVDGRRPGLVSPRARGPLVVNGATLTLRYDEMLDENSVPPSAAFTVTVNAVSDTVTAVSLAAHTVTLTLRTPVGASNDVALMYTAPTGAGATPIRDLVGNTADGFDRPVRNDTPPLDVVVSFGAGQYTATEGGTAAAVLVTVDKDPERTVEIPLTTTHHGGATDADYAGVPAHVTFTSGGSTSQTFLVTATDGDGHDAGESVQLGFGSPLPVGVAVGSPATTVVTIADPTRPPPPPATRQRWRWWGPFPGWGPAAPCATPPGSKSREKRA